MKLYRLIFSILMYLKYRKVKFKTIGQNAKYKVLNSYFVVPENISIGDNVNIGPKADFDGTGGIEIGEGVIFGPGVIIYSRTHNFNSPDLAAIPFDNVFLTAKVTIKPYVWVGRNVIILPGVTIGKGAVIGAGAVVAKDIPDYGIAVGNPARVIKYRSNIDVFEKLLHEPTPFVYEKFGRKKINRELKK